MVIDTQPHCQIEYVPELRCVVQTWRGLALSAQFRESIEKTIAFSKTHEVRSIISDTREQKLVAIEDIKWLATVGNPLLSEAGVQKLAFIAPKDFATRMGEDDYATRSRKQLTIRWFMSLEQAKSWLAEAD